MEFVYIEVKVSREDDYIEIAYIEPILHGEMLSMFQSKLFTARSDCMYRILFSYRKILSDNGTETI